MNPICMLKMALFISTVCMTTVWKPAMNVEIWFIHIMEYGLATQEIVRVVKNVLNAIVVMNVVGLMKGMTVLIVKRNEHGLDLSASDL